MKNTALWIALLMLLVPLWTSGQTDPASGKRIVVTKNSPAAIGPYSQGIVAGGFLFTSGQIPIHPVTGEVPASIEEQTKQVLENLKAIIEAAGSKMEKVVKCTVYLKNMDDFAVMNKIYATYFPNNPPARATVGISGLAKNALVEIDAIAIVN
jgi:2-iminobutanoate/2-iminopropanoate deaminase